ncbi:MAG: hypothetical protein WBE26_18875 [Phycisphaerae bacterium]
MSILVKSMWVLALLTFAPVTESQSPRPDPWNRILLVMEGGTTHGNAEPVDFLKSLSPDEMLLGARQACEEVASRAGEMQDMPPADVAEIYVMVCLHYYFEKVGRDKGAKVLLSIISDRAESEFLRRALISRMWNRDEPFDAEFQAYLKTDEERVTGLLPRILKDRGEHLLVRTEAMDCLGVQLGREVSKIIRSDPNLREVVKEKREHTNKVVNVSELVRSREVALTEETLKALNPIEARTRAYIKLLGAILADQENEPEQLRKQARRKLKDYRKSALTGIDDEVEKALQEAGN